MNEKKNRDGEVEGGEERRGEAMDTQTGGGREGGRQTDRVHRGVSDMVSVRQTVHRGLMREH